MTPARTIAALCARPRRSERQQALLSEALRGFSAWDELLELAAWEGVGGLLRSHLKGHDTRGLDSAQLAGVYLRQRRRSEALRRGLEEAVATLDDAGLRVMLLKGAALAHTLYEDPAHRPMSDLDLLVHPERSAEARRVLLEAGFEPREAVPGRQHEDAIVRVIDGIDVVVEVHHRALWDQHDQVLPALWDDGLEVPGLGPARMAEPTTLLWQVFHHAFRAQIYWVPYRLIWVADLVGLLDDPRVDLDATWARYPTMARALPMLDVLTPLPERAVQTLGPPRALTAPGEAYLGYPRTPFAESWRHSLWPGAWWLAIRYGFGTHPLARAWARVYHWGTLFSHAWLP